MLEYGPEQPSNRSTIGTYSHLSFLVVANTPTGRNSIAFEDRFLSEHNSKITEIKLVIKVNFCTR